ncbi:FkbM family methyltransferase [Streptomyces sp. NPDC048172]|uniref:FkbM family methyltransferase n=1 Tax=Streptomyces sp. NPDC048172 TaxID=3365505 RepID=UPI00371BB4A7
MRPAASVRALAAALARRRPSPEPPQPVGLLRAYGVNAVLDVGAHAGGYGALLRGGGYDGRLISFEPLAGPRATLERRASRDPLWTVRPYALGEEDGGVRLRVAGNDGEGSSVLPVLARHGQTAPGAAHPGSQRAEARRLDGLWDDVVTPGERVFLRLGVRGYEGHVLRGTGRRLAECVGVQLETPLVPLYEGGLLLDEALAWARAEGLTVTAVIPGAGEPSSGRMLRCDLVLFRASELREDRKLSLGRSPLLTRGDP